MGGVEIGVVIGVGGKYCAGKGAVTRLLTAHGNYIVIDVDSVGHQALTQKASEISARFGSAVMEKDGTVNRKKLRDIVFRNRRALQQLEEIVHPWMKQQIIERVQTLRPRNIVIDAALLCYLELDRLCDVVIWIKASFLRRILRAQRRDHISLSAILYIMRIQNRLKLTRYVADIHTISNNMSEKRFMQKYTQQLKELWD